jgi:hypothetical protein
MAPQQAASASSSETSELREEEGWEDVDPDNEELSVVSFFDEKTFPSARAMVDYCKERYHFDFISVQKELGPLTIPISCSSPPSCAQFNPNQGSIFFPASSWSITSVNRLRMATRN